MNIEMMKTNLSEPKQGIFEPKHPVPYVRIRMEKNIFFIDSKYEAEGKILFKFFGFGEYRTIKSNHLNVFKVTQQDNAMNESDLKNLNKEKSVLFLSIYEVYFLVGILDKGIIEPEINKNDLWLHLSSLFEGNNFGIYFSVYLNYRAKLWIIRDGSLYGADFVLYEDHPDLVHSKYLIKIVKNWNVLKESSHILINLLRIGWTVHKEVILVCVSNQDEIDFSDPSNIQNVEIEGIQAKRLKGN